MPSPDMDANAVGVAKVALFDFDETLIRPNSLGLLFRTSSGRRMLWPLVAPLLLDPASYSLGVRLAIKRRLYRLCLKGRTNEWLREAGEASAARLPTVAGSVAALESFAADGHDVWLATASPRSFVEGAVAAYGWPVTHVVGTELSMVDDGVSGRGFSGELVDECAGESKVTQIVAALDAAYPRYVVRVAYGNLPVDGPMLELAECGYSVQHGRVALVHDRRGPDSRSP